MVLNICRIRWSRGLGRVHSWRSRTKGWRIQIALGACTCVFVFRFVLCCVVLSCPRGDLAIGRV